MAAALALRTVRTYVGLSACLVITLSGTTAWSNGATPFTISGGANTRIISQTLKGGSSNFVMLVLIDCGTSPGVLTLTDTVHSLTVQTTVAYPVPQTPIGTSRYIRGGASDVFAPTVVPNGDPGSTTYLYQILAKTASGGTIGFVYGVDEGHIAECDTGNVLLSSSNYNAISWNSAVGATGYDVWRSLDSGTTWAKIASTLQGLYFEDKSLTQTPSALPTSDTSAIGSDSNNGLAWTTAYASLTQAASVAVSGDIIYIDGCARDSSTVSVADGVLIQGTGRYVSQIFNNQGTHIGVNSDVSDITFAQQLNNDPTTTTFPIIATNGHEIYNTNFWRVLVSGNVDGIFTTGNTNALYINMFFCEMTTLFDNTHLTANPGGISFNAIFTRFFADGSAGGGEIRAFVATSSGAFVFRECQFEATFFVDSGSVVSRGLDLAIGVDVTFWNCNISSGAQDIYAAAGTGSNFRINNTAYNNSNSVFGTATVTATSVPLIEPLLNAFISTDPGITNVKSGTNYSINGVSLTGTYSGGGTGGGGNAGFGAGLATGLAIKL